MKFKKEIIVGITVVLTVLIIITVATGIYGVLYIGVGIIVAIISINLFSNKSTLSKTTAVIINTDIIYKILMPNKFKKEIDKLKENEDNKNT